VRERDGEAAEVERVVVDEFQERGLEVLVAGGDGQGR
jgi:hypothetical protein